MPVRATARNNAELCDAVCRKHGIAGVFAPDAWTSARRTPPLYPDAVTLEPGISASDLLARIDAGPGCSVKDSFVDLDLRGHGFETLFAAEWIQRPPQSPPAEVPGPIRWTADPAPDGFVKLDGYTGNEVVAGALLNRSADVVGVSNVTGAGASLDDIWPGLLAAITEAFPDLTIVGYESGDALDAALRHGFTPLGPLRVWIKPD